MTDSDLLVVGLTASSPTSTDPTGTIVTDTFFTMNDYWGGAGQINTPSWATLAGTSGVPGGEVSFATEGIFLLTATYSGSLSGGSAWNVLNTLVGENFPFAYAQADNRDFYPNPNAELGSASIGSVLTCIVSVYEPSDVVTPGADCNPGFTITGDAITGTFTFSRPFADVDTSANYGGVFLTVKRLSSEPAPLVFA